MPYSAWHRPRRNTSTPLPSYLPPLPGVKKQHPAKLVVAVPVAAQDIKQPLLTHANEVVVLETPPFPRAASQAYESFYNLTDEQALAFMARPEGCSALFFFTLMATSL
jgi:hypothetical protein